MSEESATGNNQPTGAAPAAEPAAAVAAAAPAATQQQAPEGQPAPAASAPSEPPAAAPALPEVYEFKDAAGKVIDPKLTTKIADTARALGLSQDAAQKFLESVATTQAGTQSEATKAFYADIGGMPDSWEQSTKVDPELGGDKLPETLATAKKAVDAFSTPALRTLLEKTGFGNNPEIIRFMAKVGKAMSEDKLVPGGKAPTPGEKSLADRLFTTPAKTN